MSVQSNTYVLVGVKLDYDHFAEEEFDELEIYRDSAYNGICHHNGLCLIDDGMGGEYCFIGRVLAKSIDENGEGICPTDCTTDGSIVVAEVADLLKQHFCLDEPDVRVWAFTHYR
ncbi:TPA: hypothetical protein NIJ01_006300 [Pseudomonas aeruginosa]|nr:hypothetical protein [Pseudomonas aeruginosa]HEB4079325.1 hypothetical protein [Pseudomonas aeruginosa]